MVSMFDMTSPAQAMASLHAFNQAHLWAANAFWRMTHAAAGTGPMAGMAALGDRLTRAYAKPAFAIPGLREDVTMTLPFCNLVRFVREGDDGPATRRPRVLLFAPMSGHYATLLRETVEGLVNTGHDVSITDWQCASRVPQGAGAFSLNSYISYAMQMIRAFNGDVHVVAVCQPGPAVLAALSLMEAANDPRIPKSVALMGAPIDTRISPTAVNALAREKGTAWFRENVLAAVPPPAPGAGRPVYPGVLQLAGFMSMNVDRHIDAHRAMFNAAVTGDRTALEKHDRFYDEYKAVMDLDAAFYMDTIEKIFVEHHLPRGMLAHTGLDGKTHTVEPAAIRRIALMTVEGEKDDITGAGQTMAAHDLCPNIPASMRVHHVQERAGHYGIFSGSRWHGGVLPQLAQFVAAHDRGLAPAPQRVPAVQG